MKIFISAGHHLKDQGTSWGTLKENELTIRVRDAVFKLLIGENFFPPDNLTLKETIEWINERANLGDLAVEIHFNSNSNASLRGTEAYYWFQPRFAEVFSRKVAEALGIPNRGPKPDHMSYVGELGFLRKLKCDSVLVECLYLSNQADRDALNIEAIARGIKAALDELYPPLPEKKDLEKIEELRTIQVSLLKRVLSALQAKLAELLAKV